MRRQLNELPNQGKTTPPDYTLKIGPALTNYYPLVERVIASLSDPTNEARNRVYKTAHVALRNQLALATNFTKEEVFKEHSQLKVAISQVERSFCLKTTATSIYLPPGAAHNSARAKLNDPGVLPSHKLGFIEPAIVLQESAAVVARAPSRVSRGGISSSTALLAANLSEAILPFFRNIALARLMPPSQFGLAISLSVVLGMVEVLTDFGLPIFAVRRDTPAPADETMNTLQTLALIRSSVLAVVFVVISPWVAAAFGAPDATWTYALLGPIALIRGLENLGTKEAMRDFVFWREAVALASTQLVWVLVTVLMAALTHAFASMIWGMLAGTVAMFVLTHALSPRRYRLGWNPIAREDAARFGRPLIINGFAVALSMADRLLVGSLLGPVILAIYNVGYGTAMLPRTVLTKFLTSAFLPLFIRERSFPTIGINLFDTWAWCLSFIGLCYGLTLAFVGDRIIGLVFTDKYQPSRLFMAIAGVSVCVKFLMLLPVPAAYASGNTKLVTLGSVLSASVVVPGALVLILQHSVDMFLVVMTASEFVALIAFTRLTMKEQAFTPRLVWGLIVVPVVILTLTCLGAYLISGLSFTLWIEAGAFLSCTAICIYLYTLIYFEITLHSILR